MAEKRLIDADKLKLAIRNDVWITGVNYARMKMHINKQPTVEAVEVVHGRWKFLDIDGWWFNECSSCGATTPNRDGSPPDWNYCPNCGAKMDGGRNE